MKDDFSFRSSEIDLLSCKPTVVIVSNVGVGQKRILTLDTDVAPKECLVEQPVEIRVSFRKL